MTRVAAGVGGATGIGAPDAADLVVTDPVQAGVMAVMAISDQAKFNVARLTKRRF